jgi:hypothetical protein
MSKEENKYYVPTIEEFHVGFEYEKNMGKLLKTDKLGWERFEYLGRKGVLSSFKIASEIGNVSDFYRVKHLDREDIESLGFKYDDKRDEYYKGNIIIEFNNKTNVTIGRYQEDYPMGEHTSWTDDLFIGTIKNKSELKIILKMIGV